MGDSPDKKTIGIDFFLSLMAISFYNRLEMRKRKRSVSALTLTLTANLTGVPHFTNTGALRAQGCYVPELTADDNPDSTDLLLCYEAVANSNSIQLKE